MPRAVKIVATREGGIDADVLLGLERRGRGRSRGAALASRRGRRARPRRFRQLRRRPSRRRSDPDALIDGLQRSDARARHPAHQGLRRSRGQADAAAGAGRRRAFPPRLRPAVARRARARASRLVVIAQKGVDRAAIAAALAGPDRSMHIRPHRDPLARRNGRGGRSRSDAGRRGLPVLLRQRPRCARRAYEAEPEPKPTLQAREPRRAAPSLFGRSLSREGVRERALRRRAGARRRGLLALRRRRTCGARARGAASSSPFCRATGVADARLEEASTLPPDVGRGFWRYFDEGGPPTTWPACLAFVAAGLGAAERRRRRAPVARRSAVSSARLLRGRGERAARAHRLLSLDLSRGRHRADRGARARAARAKASRRPASIVTSLKDEAAIAPLARADLREERSTSSSTRPPFRPGSTMAREPFSIRSTRRCCRSCWPASSSEHGAPRRAASAADLAMHVVLPEIDGRILTRAISFKAAGARGAATRIRRRRCIGRSPTASPSSPISPCPGRGCRRKPARRKAARLRPVGLSGARRPHRLRRRARHAASAVADRRDARAQPGYDVGADCDAPSADRRASRKGRARRR